MSFILRQLHSTTESLSVQLLPLINSKSNFVVVTERHALNIFIIGTEGGLELRTQIPIFETIISVEHFESHLIDGVWLFVLTEDKILKVIGFGDDLDAPYEVFSIALDETPGFGSLSIQPGTLCVDPSRFFSFYTHEGTLVYYAFDFGKDGRKIKNLPSTSTKKQNIYKDPKFFTLTRVPQAQGRSPMLMEDIQIHSLINGDSLLSVIYRDDLYHYFHSYISIYKGNLNQDETLQLPEEVSPLSLSIERGYGTLFFTKSGMLIRACSPLKEFFLSDGIRRSKDLSVEVINDVENDGDFQYLLKRSRESLDVASAISLEGDGNVILLSTRSGDLFITRIEFMDVKDPFDEVESLELSSWTVHKLKGSLPPSNSMVQLSSDTILLLSRLGDKTIVKLDAVELTLETIYQHKGAPPVLDFNITASDVPKLQVMGGDDLNSGLIRTLYDGYEIERETVGVLKLGEPILGFWKFDDIVIAKSLESFYIFKKQEDGKFAETEDFHGLKNVNGDIFDLYFSNGRLDALTEFGIYQNGVIKLDISIKAGEFMKHGDVVFESGNYLMNYSGKKLQIPSETCSRHSLTVNKVSYVLVGYWDGGVDLFIDEVKSHIHTSQLPIKSVLIKRMGKKIVCIVGSGDGSVLFISNFTKDSKVVPTTLSFKIGDTPTEVVDYRYDNVIAYSSENTVLFSLDEDFSIVERGYLKLNAPDSLKYSPDKDELSYLKYNKLQTIKVSKDVELLTSEIRLPRLVRKCGQFINHMHLSVFITIHEEFNEALGSKVICSQIEVMNNNTFKTTSIYKFEPGVEITNIVNTKYRKVLMDTYEEENISLAMENVFSQCFVVSCITKSQDDTISPLMLFSIDEEGQIQYQCSTPVANVSYYGLVNHANRLVIGAGNVVGAYRIEYSMSDNKFSLNRVSDYFKTQYYFSHVISKDPAIIVGDVISGPKALTLKVKQTTEPGDTIFKLVEAQVLLPSDHVTFLTALEYESYGFLISADSLNSIRVHGCNEEGFVVLSEFNIGERVNVIKKVEKDASLNESLINRNDLDQELGLPPIVPCFVIGTASGGVYSLSYVLKSQTKVELNHIFDTILENEIIGKFPDSTVSYLKARDIHYNDEEKIYNLLDGDLLHRYGDNNTRKLVEKYCSLL